MTPDAILAAIAALAGMIDTLGRVHLAKTEKMSPEQVQEEEARFLTLTKPAYETIAKLFAFFNKDQPHA